MSVLVGKKCGMTRLFVEDGAAVPVTVIQVMPNRVVQIKDITNDGYQAVQVTYGTKSLSKLNKAETGHFAKAKVEPGVSLCEILLSEEEKKDIVVGSVLTVETFNIGDKVDVCGVSRGKGFAGVVKRHNFRTQDATHGNSLSHRGHGSIGQRQTPGRVFKGKKMSGHLGCEKCTVQNQKVLHIDSGKGLIFVNGGIPGSPNGQVVIKHSVKN